jgi:hypothetical protein
MLSIYSQRIVAKGIAGADPTHSMLHQASQWRNTFGRFQNNIQVPAGSRLMKGIFARRFQVHDFIVSFYFDQYLFTARNHPHIVLTVTTVHILCRIFQSDKFSFTHIHPTPVARVQPIDCVGFFPSPKIFI